MNTTVTTQSLGETLKVHGDLIHEAEATYEACKKQEAIARNQTTEALNRLNQLQKEFEVIVGRVQQAAPIDSDWGKIRRACTEIKLPKGAGL